jgi:hypothetical protein
MGGGLLFGRNERIFFTSTIRLPARLSLRAESSPGDGRRRRAEVLPL